MATLSSSAALPPLESSNELSTSRLIEHLARHESSVLTALLGPSTTELLNQTLDVGATSPQGLAYFFARVYGDCEALRRPNIRTLLLSKLDQAEATQLCQLFLLPTISPHQTLTGINFDVPGNLELLGRWFGIEGEELAVPVQPVEGAQKAVASHKLWTHQLSAFRELRRTFANPTATLVHMPFGAGKLRLVATAALDFFRTAGDDRSVIWFAPGSAMCEEAFLELRDLWKQFGSRDTTLLQLYGSYPMRDLDRLGGAIAVVDILRISKDDAALEKLGAITSVAVLADAENLVHPVGAEIVRRMSVGGAFSLVGILASPGAAIPPGVDREKLKAAFSGGCITIEATGEQSSLLDEGALASVSGVVVPLVDATHEVAASSLAPHSSNNSLFDFDESYVCALDSDVERNASLLALLQAEVNKSGKTGRVVFFATTPASARLFAGLLPVLGIPARSITSDEPMASRTLSLQRFVARGERILCVHGFLLAGSSIPEITSCVVASPIESRASFLSTIGRLVQGRDINLPKLRLIVAADANADEALVASLDTWSTLGDWPAPKS